MAWTTPTTRTTGELITASIWNTDLVDDLKYLKGSPTIDGTLIVESTATFNNGLAPFQIDASGGATASGMCIFPWKPTSGIYSNGDTTPTVSKISYLTIANSSATTISNFDNGVNLQVIILHFEDANTTIDRTNAALAGGVNFTSTASDIIALVLVGSVWVELFRSINS